MAHGFCRFFIWASLPLLLQMSLFYIPTSRVEAFGPPPPCTIFGDNTNGKTLSFQKATSANSGSNCDNYVTLSSAQLSSQNSYGWVVNVPAPSNPTYISSLQIQSTGGTTLWRVSNTVQADQTMFLPYAASTSGSFKMYVNSDYGSSPIPPTFNFMAIYPKYITALTPSTNMPTNSPLSLTLTVAFGFDLWFETKARLGFSSTTTCSQATIISSGTPTINFNGQSGKTSIPITHPGLSTAGTYQLCFSPDEGGNWFPQSSLTLGTVAVTGSLLTTSTQLGAVARGQMYSMSITGGGFPSARVVWAPSGMCNVPIAYFTPIISYTPGTQNPQFTIPGGIGVSAPSWVVVPCYSLAGSTFVEQTNPFLQVTVADSQPDSITAMAPATFLVSTVPQTTFTGAIATLQTRLALSTDDCGTVANSGACIVSYTSIVPTVSFTGCTFTAPQSLSLCYNVEGSTTAFVKQGLVRVSVTADPNAAAITGLAPATIGVGDTPALTITGPTFGPGKWIGFAVPTTGCGTCNTTCKGITQWNVANPAVTALPSALGTWTVCYSPNGKLTWSPQVNPGVALATISASSSDVTGITPSVVGQGAVQLITMDGILGSVSTKISFSATPTNCISQLFPGIVVTGTTATVTFSETQFINTQNYSLCVSTGSTYVVQTNGLVTVWTARGDSISSMTPSYLGTGVANSISFQGDPFTGNAKVGVAANCGTDTPTGVATYSTTAPVSMTISTAGTYQLCYSVRGGAAGSWVAQSAITVNVVVAGPSDVSSFSPILMGGNTLPVFNFQFRDGQLTSQSYFAFVPAGGDCTSSGARLGTTYLSSMSVPLSSSLTASGPYDLCFTFNNVDWAKQTIDQLTVVVATPDMVTGITPSTFQNLDTASVAVTVKTFVAGSRFAFALPGQCSTTRLAATAYTNPTGSIPLGSPLDIGTLSYANLSMCFSVDDGNNWVEQNAGHIIVVKECDTLGTCEECHANVFCSWCITENICGVNLNETICPPESNVYPTTANPGCPLATFPPRLSGSTAGGTNVTIYGNGRFFPSIGMQCKWDDTINVQYTTFNVVDGFSGWCQSPAALGFISAAYLSVDFRNVPFTGTSNAQRALWLYYDCSMRNTDRCQDCYSTTRPECGACLETNECTAFSRCSGTWAGNQCPTVTSLVPQQMNFRGNMAVAVATTLLLNSSYAPDYGCRFGGDEDNDYVGAVDVNATATSAYDITCMAPPGPAGSILGVVVTYMGQVYTRNSQSLVYVDDPAALIAGPDKTAQVVAPLASVIGALLILGGIVGFIVYRRRKAKRLLLMPPPLTPQLIDRLVFGDFKAIGNTSKVYPHVGPLMELLLIPNSPVVAAIARCCDASEADQVCRALVYIAESRRQTISMMKMLVTQEIKSSEHMSTLFRTNSFVTKMFKVYSKLVGLEFLHDTLGYELNAAIYNAMREKGDADVKDDSNDDVQLTKLVLLTVCQRVFLALTKAETKIPSEFRMLFTHVKVTMEAKFPLIPGQLASLTAGSLQEEISETRDAIKIIEGQLTGGEGAQMQQRLTAYQRVASPDAGLEKQLQNTQEAAEHVVDHVMAMLKACRDLKDGMHPDSEGGKRVLLEHGYAQNAIAVGGFFFLRFVIPAITAPEAYALMREVPDENTTKTLVLCGKVLQNLSNDKEMGGKEAYMAKMNEFILANRKAMHKFQANLVQDKPCVRDYMTVAVPAKQLEEASVYLYDFITTRLKQIVNQLDQVQPDEDDRGAITRLQTVGLLIKVLDAVHGNAGEYASKPKTADATGAAILESRKSEGVATARLQTISLSQKGNFGENPFMPGSLDGAKSQDSAGVGSGSSAAGSNPFSAGSNSNRLSMQGAGTQANPAFGAGSSRYDFGSADNMGSATLQ